MKISLFIIALIVRGCFDQTHNVTEGFDEVIFALDARALLLHNYDKLTRIFSCI